MSDNYKSAEELWDEADFELPSANEAKSSKFDLDPVPDGLYQVRILEISDRLKNNFDENADRRAITFRILRDMDTPEDTKYVGAKFRQYMNVSSHPKSTMYAYLKAAAGGQLDPSERPKLSSLRDAQIIGSLITKLNEQGEEKQVFEGIRAAKKPIQDPPF